ncbi:caspase family protein [Streptomyces sp. NPDC089919]|uniref:caspase, EACC1-associated type n=1 Tax=Streptomyces sp. NPDC089919 TaxID=3155188 RepID=UPI003416EA06
MELADPQGSYAVLIGSSRYADPGLEDLPSVAANLHDLGRLLEDPAVWGLPPGHCVRIPDPAGTTDVLDAVHRAAQRATDSLLVYFAGHGLPGPDGDGLLLALPGADPERPYTWLDFRDVRREVLGSGKRVHRAVVLDCCYSGQALAGGMSGPVTLTEQARIAGTYLLTSTSANTMALAPPGEAHTAFTGELIRLLERGLPGAGPLLTGPDLYDHLLAELRAKGRPLPQQRLSNTGRTLAFARNRYGAAARATEPAVPQPPAPVVPEPFREVLRAQPRVIADRAAVLAATDPDASWELLRLAAVTRPAQEVAALVRLLLGREPYPVLSRPLERIPRPGAPLSEVVHATAAADRSPGDLAVFARALRALDADDEARLLVHRIAAFRRPEDVAATIRALSGSREQPEGDAAALLDAAIRFLRTTEAVLELAGALWSAELDECADRVLRAPAVSAPPEAARLADALRAMGRVAEGLTLYSSVLADGPREPAEVVRMVAAAERAGGRIWAHTFVEAAAAADTSVPATGGLCDALWAAGLAGHARSVLTSSASRLKVPELISLGDLLHAQGHGAEVLILFDDAAGHRSPEDGLVLVRALREAGRPLDAQDLLAALARRPVEFVAGLLAGLDGPGAGRDRDRVMAALPTDLAARTELIRILIAGRRPYGYLMGPFCRLPALEMIEQVHVWLGQFGDAPAHELLHHLVQTAPDRAVELLECLEEAGPGALGRFVHHRPLGADPLLDRTVLRALLTTVGGRATAPLEPVSDLVIDLLVNTRGQALDRRVTAIAALCRAGLTERVDRALARSNVRQPNPDVVALAAQLTARGLSSSARSVIRGAGWMSPETHRQLVRDLMEADLTDLAMYAEMTYGGPPGPGAEAGPAMQRDLGA